MAFNTLRSPGVLLTTFVCLSFALTACAGNAAATLLPSSTATPKDVLKFFTTPFKIAGFGNVGIGDFPNAIAGPLSISTGGSGSNLNWNLSYDNEGITTGLLNSRGDDSTGSVETDEPLYSVPGDIGTVCDYNPIGSPAAANGHIPKGSDIFAFQTHDSEGDAWALIVKDANRAQVSFLGYLTNCKLAIEKVQR